MQSSSSSIWLILFLWSITNNKNTLSNLNQIGIVQVILLIPYLFLKDLNCIDTRSDGINIAL